MALCVVTMEACKLNKLVNNKHTQMILVDQRYLIGLLCYKPEGRGFDSQLDHWAF